MIAVGVVGTLQPHHALGEHPGLVGTQDVHAAQVLDGAQVADQDAVASHHPGVFLDRKALARQHGLADEEVRHFQYDAVGRNTRDGAKRAGNSPRPRRTSRFVGGTVTEEATRQPITP
jgi:hypothetical protein